MGLLRERPAPTEREVRDALGGNLCRCGAHGRIIRAVLKAAGQVSAGQVSAGQAPARVPAEGIPAGARPVPALPSDSPGPVGTAPAVPSGVSPLPANLPADLAANPVLARWLDFSRDGEVTIRIGKVEYGQGIWTALAQPLPRLRRVADAASRGVHRRDAPGP